MRPIAETENDTICRAVGLDWDGTCKDTYKTLEAVWMNLRGAAGEVGLHPQTIDEAFADLAAPVARNIPMQHILHRPTALDDAARLIFHRAEKTSSTLTKEDLRLVRLSVASAARAMAAMSNDLAPGFPLFLRHANDARTAVCIISNSGPEDVFQEWIAGIRQSREHVDPKAIARFMGYAKDPHSAMAWREHLQHHWLTSLTGRVEVFPSPKPNTAPVLDLRARWDIPRDRFLLGGESPSDLRTAIPDLRNPDSAICHFAYQEDGANRISDRQQRVNRLLRGDKHPLGPQVMEAALAQMQGPEGRHPFFSRWPEGFRTANDRIETGKLVLEPTTTPRIIFAASQDHHAFTQEEIDAMRRDHAAWLADPDKGERADFTAGVIINKNLTGDWRGATFDRAYLLATDCESARFERPGGPNSEFTTSFVKTIFDSDTLLDKANVSEAEFPFAMFKHGAKYHGMAGPETANFYGATFDNGVPPGVLASFSARDAGLAPAGGRKDERKTVPPPPAIPG